MGRRFIVSSGLAALTLLVAIGSQPAMAQSEGAYEDAQGDLEKRRSIAAEIIDLGVPMDQREQLFFRTSDQMTSQMREAALKNLDANDTRAIEIIDDWLDDWVAQGKVVLKSHIPQIMTGWKNAYADIYSVDELTDIRDFVATPSGARFFQRQQEIMANPHFASANQAYMNEVMANLPEAQKKLRADLTAYYSEKAQSAER